jgi:large subunit ribosomal protein L11
MVKINLLIDGGNMKPGPAVAQQLGPMGVNMGKVISDVNEATKEFKGMKVPVELDVDEKTKDFTIHTSSPPTSELLKNELGLEKGSDKHAEIKVGNASIEDMIKIAKIKLPNMLDRDMKAAVKSVLGTSASVGILVENENPNDLIQVVNEGKFDTEINEGKTETSPEKREKLNQFFTEVKSEQEAKAAAAAKEAEEAEAKKAEEAEAETTEEAAPTETTPAEAAPTETTPTEEKK